MQRRGPTLTVASVTKKSATVSTESPSKGKAFSRPPRPPVKQDGNSKYSKQQSPRVKQKFSTNKISESSSIGLKRQFPGKENYYSSLDTITSEDEPREVLIDNKKSISAKSMDYARYDGQDEDEASFRDSLSSVILPKGDNGRYRNAKKSSVQPNEEIRQILNTLQTENENILIQEENNVLQEQELSKKEMQQYLLGLRNSLAFQKQNTIPELREFLLVLNNANSTLEELRKCADRDIFHLEKTKNERSLEEKFEKYAKDLRKQVLYIRTALKLYL